MRVICSNQKAGVFFDGCKICDCDGLHTHDPKKCDTSVCPGTDELCVCVPVSNEIEGE